MAAGKILLAWNDSVGNSFELLFGDAILSDNVVSPVEVTSYPVEEGSPITDNVRPAPKELSFDVYVSALSLNGTGVRTLSLNVPQKQALGIGAALSAPGDVPSSAETYVPPDGDPVLSVMDTLDVLQGRVPSEPPALITLTTTKKAYSEKFVLKQWSGRRTKEEGSGGAFTLEFVAIDFAFTKTVPTPKPTAIRANTKKKKGAQDPKPIAAGPKKSLAAAAADNLAGHRVLQ